MIFIMMPPTKLLVAGAACLALLMTAQAQSLNPTPSISNAGTVNTFTGGYTFAYATSGSPWNGALISFGGFNNTYDCQLSTDYGSGGRHISFRMRNGDAATWNPWYEIWNSANLNNSTSDFNAQNIFAYGNVGIGTTTPQTKLHLYQALPDAAGLIIQGNTINIDNTQHYIAMTLDGDYGNGHGNYSQIRSYSNLYNNWGSQLAFFTTQAGVANTLMERMRIDANGHVSIGTITAGSYMLAVNGNVHARQVNVDVIGWGDYVFKSNYMLAPLSRVKAYVDQYHHLPGIPSEKQIIRDGLNMGEINKLLVKKVEELTLYLIANDKTVKEQSAQLKSQQEQISSLQEQLDRLLKNSGNKLKK